MTLHVPIGRNRYCGPGALAILTGRSTDDTARVLRQVSGKRAICGIGHDAMTGALRWLDYRATVAPVPLASVSLERWAAAQAPGRYLVAVTGHYVVVCVRPDGRIEVADNLSVYPHPLARFPRRRQLVRKAWRVVHVNAVAGIAIDSACITCGDMVTGSGVTCDGCRA